MRSAKQMQSFVGLHSSHRITGQSSSRQQALEDQKNLPLFELAALTPKENQVNLKKLNAFLEINGTTILHAGGYFHHNLIHY
jgi:hypothetical protein